MPDPRPIDQPDTPPAATPDANAILDVYRTLGIETQEARDRLTSLVRQPTPPAVAYRLVTRFTQNTEVVRQGW